jgi:hypothetical protein
LNRTLLRLSLTLTAASFLFVMPVPAARPQATGPPSAGTVGSDLQPSDFQFPQVVVVGERASLAAAEQNKRDAIGIVDSVVDDDIARLPDLNVTEALQRITGIQIQRDLGEGSSPSSRGLTQMETLLNGREVFTAGINLLGTMRRSYYGVTTRPQSAWLDDTQLAVTVTIRI